MENRNEQVPKVSLGFHSKGHRVTFACATWAAAALPFPQGGEAGFTFLSVVFTFRFP